MQDTVYPKARQIEAVGADVGLPMWTGVCGQEVSLDPILLQMEQGSAPQNTKHSRHLLQPSTPC